MRVSSFLLCAPLLLCACDRSPAPPPPAPAVKAPTNLRGNPAANAKPLPELTSGEVVGYQMLALQNADVPEPDAGIAIAFRFASPENQQQTGPVERFIGIVKAPGYLPMLGCEGFEVSPAEEAEGTTADGRTAQIAQHLVRVTPRGGGEIVYLFTTRKQPGDAGEVADCWMVDGVQPVAVEPPGGEAPPPPPPEAPASPQRGTPI